MNDEVPGEFVDRPTVRRPYSLLAKLIETADNGKAVVMNIRGTGGYWKSLRRRGLQMHTTKRPDGKHLAWAEPIPPGKRKKA